MHIAFSADTETGPESARHILISVRRETEALCRITVEYVRRMSVGEEELADRGVDQSAVIHVYWTELSAYSNSRPAVRLRLRLGIRI